MADDRLRELDRAGRAGDPGEAERAARERCRQGLCCAHALPLLAEDDVGILVGARVLETWRGSLLPEGPRQTILRFDNGAFLVVLDDQTALYACREGAETTLDVRMFARAMSLALSGDVTEPWAFAPGAFGISSRGTAPASIAEEDPEEVERLARMVGNDPEEEDGA